MPFDPIQADVDGTLRNPLVAGTVLAWALVLLLVCLVSLKVARRFGSVAVASVLLAGWLLGPFVVGTLVNGLYRITASSVGVFGRPPAWIAPVVAGAGVLAIEGLTRRRR